MPALPAQYAGTFVDQVKDLSVVMTEGTQELGTHNGSVFARINHTGLNVKVMGDRTGTAADKKPSFGTDVSTVQMTPRTIAAISQVPKELYEEYKEVTAGDNPLLERIVADTRGEIARKVDKEVFFGGTLLGANPSVVSTNNAVVFDRLNTTAGYTYSRLADALIAVDSDLYEVDFSAWAATKQLRGIALRSVDTSGRPLFIAGPRTNKGELEVADLLGAPVYYTSAAFGADPENASQYTLALGGDFSKIHWAQVGGVEILVDYVGTVNGKSAIEENLVNVRIEVKVAAYVENPDLYFVKVTESN